MSSAAWGPCPSCPRATPLVCAQAVRLSPLVLFTENSRQRAPSTRGDSLGAHQGRRPWTAGARAPRDTGHRKDGDRRLQRVCRASPVHAPQCNSHSDATHCRSEATTGLQGFTSSRCTTQLPLRRLHTVDRRLQQVCRASLVHAALRNSHCGGYTRSIGYNGSAGLH